MVARIFENIVEAFFGTPRRVQVTAVLALVGVIYFNPGLAEHVGGRVFAELQPLLAPAIMIGGIYLIIFGRRRGGGGRRR